MEQEWADWDQKAKDLGIDYVTEQEGFKDWICHAMMQRLDRMPDQGLEDEPVEHVKIAKCTMAFKNAEIIQLLRERGTAIKTEQWEKQAETEKKINELKAEKLEELTTPCSLFLTFENEEGIARALKYDEAVEADPELADCKYWLGDEVIEIQPASEPSDIIWENRAFTPTDRLKKGCVVFLILAICLLGSGMIIFGLSAYSAALLSVYPVVDCVPFNDAKTPAEMQESAYLEYAINSNLEAAGQDVAYAGYV